MQIAAALALGLGDPGGVLLKAARTNDLRSQNRLRVISVCRRAGVVSRTEIGDLSGLSPATVSAITSDFLHEGVLIPPLAEKVSGQGRGRPKVALQINPAAAIVCAVYFQLNQVSVELVDYAGISLGEFSQDLESRKLKRSEIRAAMTDCIHQGLKASGLKKSALSRIALGFQGVTDAQGASVLWTPICVQKNLPVCQWLEQEFDVPVKVSNDCDRIAQALNWHEPEKYGSNFGVVLLAHGVGMGLHLGEGIINGIRSSGFEFGHMTYKPNGALCRCGRRGCIEAYAGDYAIKRRAQGESNQTPPADLLEFPDLNCILDAAHRQEPGAIAAIEEAGAAIGTGIASLYTLLDQFPIVFVGGGTALFSLMEESVQSVIGSAPGGNHEQLPQIDCYLHEAPLVREGAAISALLQHDNEVANNRIPVASPAPAKTEKLV